MENSVLTFRKNAMAKKLEKEDTEIVELNDEDMATINAGNTDGKKRGRNL